MFLEFKGFFLSVSFTLSFRIISIFFNSFFFEEFVHINGIFRGLQEFLVKNWRVRELFLEFFFKFE